MSVGRLRALPLADTDTGGGVHCAHPAKSTRRWAHGEYSVHTRQAINSSASVLFYLNSMMDWQQYDLHGWLPGHTVRVELQTIMRRTPAIQFKRMLIYDGIVLDTMVHVWKRT